VFHEGAIVSADVRGLGTLTGKIAWSVEGRVGISFDQEIDPREARTPIAAAKPRVLFKPIVDKSRRPGLKPR
jgi:hypothetical protein